jgi:hypothetical protein
MKSIGPFVITRFNFIVIIFDNRLFLKFLIDK